MFQYLKDGMVGFDARIADLEPVYGPNRGGDIPHSLADITKASNELGFRPAIMVNEGLKLTCEWFAKLKINK